MKNIIIFYFMIVVLYAQDKEMMFKQAVRLEQEGDLKKAIQLYKEIAKDSLPHGQIDQEQKYQLYRPDITKKDNNFFHKNSQISKILGIKPYRTNYLMPITTSFKNIDGREKFESKFQISFIKPLFYDLFGLNEVISIAYTQTSWWQTWQNSMPFRETNYKPEISIAFPTFENNEAFKQYQIGFLHDSNGRGVLHSRSWNRVYLDGIFEIADLTIIPRVWYRFNESKKKDINDYKGDDNPNITYYVGNGDINFIYNYKKHTFKLLLTSNLHLDKTNKTSALGEWIFPIFDSGFYGYIQFFSGYGESLIDYDRYINKIGMGFSITR